MTVEAKDGRIVEANPADDDKSIDEKIKYLENLKNFFENKFQELVKDGNDIVKYVKKIEKLTGDQEERIKEQEKRYGSMRFVLASLMVFLSIIVFLLEINGIFKPESNINNQEMAVIVVLTISWFCLVAVILRCLFAKEDPWR